METLIVAGGAGQEVAAAALRLSYLAGLDIPRIYAFDSDVATRPPGEGVMSRTQALHELDQQLTSLGVTTGSRVTFVNPTVIPGVATRVHHVTEVYARNGHLEADDRALIDLLTDAAQRETFVSNGFHGEPAVGALVFGGAWQRGAFKEFLEQLRQDAQTSQGLRVVLAASVAGGVGTAVLPLLARELAKLRNVSSRFELLALLQLPWFRLVRDSGDSLSRDPDVNQADFDRNAACLLKGYLQDTLARSIDAMLLVGLPRPVDRVSQGGELQLETRHYLCVCAGIATLNLLRAKSTRQMCGEEWRGVYGLALAPGKAPSAFDGPSAGPGLYLPSGKVMSVRKLIDTARCLVAFTAALKFELEADDASVTHHGAVAAALKLLSTSADRQDFGRMVSSLHGLHCEILAWLQSSLESKIGSARADTLQAFEPEANWNELFDSRVHKVLGAAGVRFSALPVSRKLITALGRYSLPGQGATGQRVAWTFVDQARRTLIGRV